MSSGSSRTGPVVQESRLNRPLIFELWKIAILNFGIIGNLEFSLFSYIYNEKTLSWFVFYKLQNKGRRCSRRVARLWQLVNNQTPMWS